MKSLKNIVIKLTVFLCLVMLLLPIGQNPVQAATKGDGEGLEHYELIKESKKEFHVRYRLMLETQEKSLSN